MTSTTVELPEVQTFPRRPETTREADMACRMHTAVTEFYESQIQPLQEAVSAARAQLAQFEQEHSARKSELEHRLYSQPSADLRKFKEEHPEEYRALRNEAGSLSTNMQALRDAVLRIEGTLDHARTCMELDLFGTGLSYGSREGFRAGVLYALGITPDAAMDALKALANDTAADELVYNVLAGKDRLRNFAIEPTNE